jgi:hypothetical protein
MKTRKFNLLILLFICVFVARQNTEAQIDYTDLSPDITIYVPDTIGCNSYLIDLNNDETEDLRIQCRSFYTHELTREPVMSFGIFVDTLGLNRIEAGPYWEGDTIKSSDSYWRSAMLLAWVPELGGWNGDWYLSVQDPDSFAYSGLKFYLNGQIFYGWIRLKTNGKEVTIDRFAWNETPNQFIIAGQSE